MDQYLIAVIVGIVEGLTEFLPVSSTGHMIIVGHVLGFDGPVADVFDVFVQLGAILSVIFIYKERFARFFTKDGWNMHKGLSVWHIAAGIVPVMAVAYFLYPFIKKYLFSPFTVAIGLALGGLLLIIAERLTKGKEAELVDDVDKITMKQAIWVGIYQFLSLWPGFSRSGSTIAGGLLVGLSRQAAANYTFLIAVPLMFVACLYDLLKNINNLSTDDLTVLGIGFVVSFIVAYWSVLWFLKFLHKYDLTSFAWYRIILAGITYWYFYL
ncbi:MAG: undecaprenyl-diphosphate phosphatase [Phascolarctobacterium sp.]|nr:undecaprenyl-diphosphate phosphatase [Phascolarctobacterium sp.]